MVKRRVADPSLRRDADTYDYTFRRRPVGLDAHDDDDDDDDADDVDDVDEYFTDSDDLDGLDCD